MQPNTFGKYILLKRLAIGGMAEIYLARQTGLQGFEKLVVVKIILPSLASEKNFVDMFLDEARLAASLNHPNVVQIFDLGREGSSYYIAMEFIAGCDLSSVVKQVRRAGEQVPVDIAVKMLAGACEGLHYAHTRKDFRGQPLNIVHRDISPSNILIGYEGAVKVVDFGIAKAESSSTKTQAGMLKGKYSYMSPEQIQGMPLDCRSDVFALGISLYEVLVGRRLYRRENELAILKDILDGIVPVPSKLRPEIPNALDAIVMKALEKDRTRRFQTAQAMQLALEGYLAAQPTPTTTSSIADFMALTFATELAAYMKLLADLPSATSEQIALSLAEHNVTGAPSSNPGSGSGSYRDSNPSLSALPEGNRENVATVANGEIDVVMQKPRSNAFKLGVWAGLLAVPLLAGLAWLFIRPPPPPVALPTHGTVALSSQPPGAEVEINGTDTGKKTPATIDDLPFGVVEVRLLLEGYQPKVVSETLSETAASKSLALELVKATAAPGTLAVSTVPDGATVFLDGRPLAGVTPMNLTGISAATEHLVRVSKDGFLDEAAPVTLAPGGTSTVALTLKPKAAPAVAVAEEKGKWKTPARPARELLAIDLTSSPVADVIVEGRRLGRTPCTVKLPAGRASLSFVNAELDLNQTVSLTVARAGKESMQFKKGKIAADVQPWADVYLGDKKLGTTPLAPRELYEGNYTLRLVNSEIGAIKTVKVTVEAGKTTVLHEKLQ